MDIPDVKLKPRTPLQPVREVHHEDDVHYFTRYDEPH
jgi:hypothetical protein